ncbi:hypothetical protein QT562_21195 [Xanthomonas citri pv. citri]|uniref:hypothetical protein n=1 Tax=Xanthomonas citri TaxID=346 RepID=UPI0011B29FB7|nr:hypothetical protein [Xanthomonas citri]MBD5030054.1 hypothetical protein [Xanthomonas citri pv. citri]MBD5038480.1 hypothetical protein [Xanthomonas citri pv. citri]
MWLPEFPATLFDPTVNRDSLFVVQVWHELLLPTSPDSFQCRTLDLSLLLEDLLHVASVAALDARWQAHLEMLATELELLMQHEERLLQGDRKLKYSLERVLSSCRRANNQEASLRQSIEIAISSFGDAPRRFAKDAEALASRPKIPKSALVSRLSTLATQVQYRGCRDESIEAIGEDLLQLAPSKVIDRLVAPLLSHKQEWTCFLAVSGKLGDIASTIGAASLRLREGPDINGIKQEAAPWLKLYSKQTHVVVSVVAASATVDARLAAGTLSALMDVHNLYRNSPTFQVHDKILVKRPGPEAQIIRIAPSVHFGLLPRSKHRYLARDRVKSLGSRLEGRLSSALECHRLAVAAQDPRAAIIDLWTALETLSGPAGPAAIGERVAKKIAPLVSWRRIDRVVTYFALEIHSFRQFIGLPIDKALFPTSTENKFAIDEVLAALCGPENNPKILALLAMAGDSSPILRHRLYEAWKELHDPESTARRLEQSKLRIEWQIYRIYRARNLLVHRGEQSHLNWRLLQNAQFYVSITLGRVLHDLSLHRDWSIDTSLEGHLQHFKFLSEGLRSFATALTHGHLLGEKSRDRDRVLWPAQTEALTATGLVAPGLAVQSAAVSLPTPAVASGPA